MRHLSPLLFVLIVTLFFLEDSVLVSFTYLIWENDYNGRVSFAVLVTYNVPHVIHETASEAL